MAMPADKDYLILNLRLAYLRRIDDRSGPRIITVPDIINAPSPPSTNSRPTAFPTSSSGGGGVRREGRPLGKDRTPYNARRTIDNILPAYRDDSQVVLAGLNDAQKHTELLWIYSPNASYEDLSGTATSNADLQGQARIDGDDPAGVHGKESSRTRATSLGTGSLKHTTTIYGPGQTGALGMRVSGQRKIGSASKRRRPVHTTSEADAAHSDSAIGTSRATQYSAPSLSSDPSDTSEPVRRDVRVPALAIQASTYETDHGVLLDPLDGQSERADDPESSTAALLRNRGRSRSQPHRPSLPSGLSNVSTFQDAEASQDGGRAQSVVAPPPRPPRKARQSISGQSVKSTSAIPTSGSEFEGMNGEQSVEGRQRSQSEAIKPYSAVSELSISQGTSSGDASMSRFGEGREQMMAMNRTHSETTLFSLASPRGTRRRGLSNKSQQSDGSTPSLDMSIFGSGAERAQHFSFAPVAEHPEGSGLDGDHNTTLTEDYRDSNTQRLVLASDGVLSPGLPIKQDLLDPWDISSRRSTLTPLNVNKDETQTSDRPETISEASIAIPPLHDAGLESASLLPESSAALSSVVGTAQGAPAGGKDGVPHSLSSSKSPSSPFLKADPLSVKKRFDERITKSTLTALISKRSEGPSNPFTQLYSGVAGSSVSGESSVVVEVLFPFALASNPPPLPGKPRSGALALHPKARSMQLSVRKDAQMEELIGYSLYCYIEEDWMPRLEDALGTDATDDQRDVRLSTLGWTLRLVEDGEVDDDYPALDRNLTVGKFGADELAICEATAAQIRQNQAASAGAGKRPRKLINVPSNLRSTALAGKSAVSSTHRTPVPNTSVAHAGTNNTMQGPSLLSSTLAAAGGVGRDTSTTRKDAIGSGTNDGDLFASLVGNSGAGTKAPVFLRILVTPNQDVRYKTTLQVTSDRYLADVLETICKRRELGNADKWAFVVPDKDIVVPLDRTVESLQGNYDLALVKRQDLGVQHSGALTMQSTNPNASIFKHTSRHERPLFGLGKDIASVYKSYTVNRRMPTFLARHERVLTIDGDWLHIIPTETRAFQNQTATTSYPISSIVSCTQARLPSSFKLVVERESDQKRYDFEAENSKVATEIVQEINKLMKRPL